MPFPIKYNSGNVTGSIIKGNVALAVNDVLGPTSTTGWYNSPNFTQGTYQIVETSASGDPEVFCAQNEAELVKFAKWKGALSGVTGSSTDALVWIGTQPNLLAINEVYPNIVTDGDILNLDAGFVGSYPVDPFQVNLLYSNGVYTPSISNLTIAVTQSTLIPNNKFRLTTPSTYIPPYTDGNFRLNIPLPLLVNSQPYNLSFNYQLISGSLFLMGDWCDTALFNRADTNYGTYTYSSAAGVRSTYDSTYRFMDFVIRTSSIVDIWNIQLTQNPSASLFNTGSGTTWYDVSGNNLSGSLFNGPLFNPNGYITFDGVDDYGLIPNTPLLQPSTSLSLECMLKPSSVVNGSWIAAYTGAANGSFVKYGFRVAGAGQLSGYINSNGSIAQTFGNNLVTGSWIHGIITYDGASAKLYCNGVLSSTTAITGSMDYNAYGSPYFFTMGRKSAIDGQYFNGSINTARVYNRALSQTEVNQNYYQSPFITNGLTLAVDAGNLVSYERGSTTTYSMTGSASGSLFNGTGYTSSYGGMWNFDGIDDRINLNTKLNVTSSFSIDYCLVIKQLPNAGQYFYLYSSTGGYQNNGVYGELGNGYFALATLNAPGSGSGVAIYDHQINTPYYVSITYENRVLKGYVNGILRSTANLTFDPTNYTSDLTSLGSFTGGGANSPIQMSLFRYYNRALSSTEVTQNFNAQKAKFGF